MSNNTKALKHQTDSLTVINRIADALASAAPFDETLQDVMYAVQNYTNADMLICLTVNPAIDILELQASVNLVDEAIYQGPVSIQDSLSGLTIRRQEIITSADIANDVRIAQNTREALSQHGLNYIISMPIVYQAQASAVINLFYRNMPEIPDRAYETMLAIGKLLGAALANNYASTSVKSSLDALQIVSELSRKMIVTSDKAVVLHEATQAIVECLDVTSAYISSFNKHAVTETVISEYVGPEANELEQKSDLGVTYDLRQNGNGRLEQLKNNVYYLENLDDPELSPESKSHLQKYGAHTVLGLPLIAQENLVGTLELWDSRSKREFSADEILIAQSIASQVAATLENIQLYEQVNRELNERKNTENMLRQKEAEVVEFEEKLSVLQDVNFQLARSNSLTELYEQTVVLGRSHLGFDRLGLLLYDENTRTIYGTFGTDDDGELRDEQYFSQVIDNQEILDVIAQKKPFKIWETAELRDEGKAVGTGWNAMAMLWYENKPLGWLAADNFLKKEPLSQNLMELMRLYALTIAHLIVRQRSEDRLREEEEAALTFQKRLQALQEVNIELVQTQSLDELYKRAVELGQEKLGFDRIGLLLYDEKSDRLHGTFGVDVKGKVVDERALDLEIDDFYRQILTGKKDRFVLLEDVPLYQDGKAVGKGWNAIAVIWTGDKGIGWLATDNMLTQAPPDQQQLDILSLYGDALGHLIAQKRTENILHERENLLQLVLDTIPQAVFWKDKDLVFLGSNQNFAQDVGFKSPDELIGKTDYDLWAKEEEVEFFREVDRRVMNADQPELGIIEPLSKGDGKQSWLSTNKVPLHDTVGKVIGILGTYEDITERRQAELELSRREEEFRELYVDAPVAYVTLSSAGNIEQANKKAAEILQLDMQKLIGQPLERFLAASPDGAGRVAAFTQKLLAGEDVLHEEVAFVTAKGKQLWLTLSIHPVLNDKSEFVAYRAAAIDITEQRRAEDALRNNEATLRKQNERLLELARNKAINSGDMEEVFRTITETAVEVIGVARASIWQYEATHITLADLFLAESQTHSDGLVLKAKDYPNYFKALAEGGAIVAHDAQRNSRTKEFSDSYLAPLGITSMLDTTAQIGGVTKAVLCLEHVGPRRRWSIEEQNFANSLSDLLALALEARGRQKLEAELQDSLELRGQQFEIGQSLAQTRTEQEVLNTIVDYAAYFPQVAISVSLFEEDTTGLADIYAAANSFDSNIPVTAVGTKTSHANQPLASYYSPNAAFISADTASDERIGEELAEMFQAADIRSIAILPMSAGGQWIGNLTLMTAQADFFKDKTLSLYRTLAEQGAISLRAARLNAQVQEALARREREVRLSTEIAQDIAYAADLNELYHRVVTQIHEEFGYYHTQLLRYDPALDLIGLIEGYGDVGRQMVELHHSVPFGVGIIGTSAATGEAVLRPDVTKDPAWQPNPLLPLTKGELAVPIKLKDTVLGVLDVQSSELNALDENDLLVLQGLCGQIAIAIESTTLRQEMESRLRELNALQRQMSKEGWLEYQATRKNVVGYQYDHSGVQPLAEPVRSKGKGKNGKSNGEGSAITTLDAPLTIRGEKIGLLGIENDPKRPLTEDDHKFIDAITREIAEALESARLFEQTQNALNEQERLTAELETVAQVSTAASTILEIDVLLQSVVDLAKTSFNLYHAHIYLVNENETRMILKAGAGNIGRLMTLEGREINIDAESLVARSARTRQGVMSNNVRKTIDYMPHPLLPKTQSELAVPMIVGDKLIGVMDLQSDELDFFTEEDLKIQRTLASQIAIAVENARQYAEQVQTASKLRELDQLKSEFLASMSHELRTPLNSIIGFADVLLEGLDGDLNERMEEDVRLIRESGRHLRDLIGDILDMSKIESGRMELRYEEIHMPQLAQDIIATASSLANEKGLFLNLDMDEKVSIIQADRTRLRQILWNITGNAIKFTDRGGVTLSMQHRKDHILVAIRDTGIGIKEENLSIVFEQFRQIDGGLNRAAGGTGLGMPITKKLVELHGGEIWIESVYGQGSTFLFTIPYDTSKRRDRLEDGLGNEDI